MSLIRGRLSLWALLGITVTAPWLLAGLVPWGATVIGAGGVVIGVAWLLGFLRRRRPDSVPAQALLSSLLLVAGGWLAVSRTMTLPRNSFAEQHLAEIAAQWPSSFAAVNPVAAMLAWSGALGVLLFVLDAEFHWTERQLVLRAAVTSAALVALVGSVLLVANAPWIFRGARSPLAGSPFATFFDAGLGAAFLALVWPVAAVGRLTETQAGWRRAYGVMAMVSWFALGAIGSLLPILVGAGAWLGLLGWMSWRFAMQALGPLVRRTALLAALCAVAATAGSFTAGRAPEWRSPWLTVRGKLKTEAMEAVKIGTYDLGAGKRPDGLILSQDDPADPAFVSKQWGKLRSACFSMITPAGLLGFGAGTWRIAFPHFCEDALLRTHYLQVQFAGIDPWQLLLEWGAVGVIGWALLLHGGFAAALYRLRRFRAREGAFGPREGMIVGAALGLLSLLACSLRSFPLQVPAIQLYAAFFLALLWAARARTGVEPADAAQDSISKGQGT